ncbi:MAG: tRNA (adenosine(37)-N6)-threonylcarbamoyltransferase complex ATPase subunit type 1 TsaE [Candidatus Brocadia sp.]|uniref:tRNA threonylcarbamoyladenosine biosynthesis protein TsaE n=1 Tax=Candidatus Brocadia fulgida TaxID=380242 RepID=A0A0M2UUL3_9BACT|nr:MAG: hypothetical protein BROFUL_03118 [Candidatus Brocadia fulgida]MCC6325600.1 tRNA (adenosine(37)-N6)-threonylcarbamoyltransferase complex ATPase subunit type 1 TsaE [Candidatus Brocadia sp.]MCE7912509.1 tRNA (adenosine(37)-N6)-threonylcarbamoyltransferase complex ATPase subunit type 1 TsaE [Candidatus Brocadia sp. AMX3]MBV6517489.1 tRNA threonylcarbamoyladenosine biosynthesis protein TsaE [Candidatus Brocadia fulgida]MDG5996757.1 tRNA (adenosine(37)-N6)-threonylcarbamoyltransferase compl
MNEKGLIFRSTSTEETVEYGKRLGMLLSPGDVVALIGELGAGKTTLVKGVVLGLGVTDVRAVKSPTFSLVHTYRGRMPVYHFDAYRLKDSQEMLDIGSDEMIYGNGVALVEWANNVPGCLPEACLRITLWAISQHERTIEMWGSGSRYDKIINDLS